FHSKTHFGSRSSSIRWTYHYFKKGDSPKKKKLGQEIGKAAAEKSRGLFSADDWQCNKCGNVNWARRQSCNMCNAPKYGEVEERTGYGGGYNDRGVVEYIERQESDDEYDEDLQRGYVDGNHKSPLHDLLFSSTLMELEGRPKDRWEDDDDGDLSKYDLSGWGDEENTEKDSKEKTIIQDLGHQVASLDRVLLLRTRTGTTITGPGRTGAEEHDCFSHNIYTPSTFEIHLIDLFTRAVGSSGQRNEELCSNIFLLYDW
ncbi:hypothetical protein L9F63_011359, partial [Diploptera punctata]